jgi:coatomer subunit beta'
MVRFLVAQRTDHSQPIHIHRPKLNQTETDPTTTTTTSASDDMTIKLWDWDKGWDCTQVFEGHAHYVMMVKFNPKDTGVFASASLDRTIKVGGWMDGWGGVDLMKLSVVFV